MSPLIRTARFTALKWDVPQCCKTNNLWVIVINVKIYKNQKWTTKNKKFENPSSTHKFYVELDPKRYLGPRGPIIGSMGYGGG